MKVATTIAAIALFLTSAIEALTIISPAAGSTYNLGQQIEILLQNDNQETDTSASITFASSCGSWVQTVPIGSTQIINLPCNVVGPTNVGAQTSSARASAIQINITPNYANNVYPNACGYPCANPCGYPCANPCGSPCGAIACPPRPCQRRSRRGCGYYAEEATSIEEFDAQQEQEQN